MADYERLEAAAGPSRGLITLERARHATALTPGDAPGADAAGDAVKLTLYLSRRQRIDGVAAHRVAATVFHRHEFAGAAVFLGVDGTVAGQRRRARFFSRNTDVPVLVVVWAASPQPWRRRDSWPHCCPTRC